MPGADVGRGIVYALTDPRIEDPLDSIRYIGMTRKRIEQRLVMHLKDARASDSCYRLRWIRSLLADALVPGIVALESAPFDLLAKREVLLIAKYRQRGARLTNGTAGGEGIQDPTEETREKMRRASAVRQERDNIVEKLRGVNTGRHLSAEHREKIRQSMIGNTHLLGIRPSVETRRKLSEAHTGLTQSTETRARKSLAIQGHTLSEEGRAKISRANRGRTPSEEARRKMSVAQKARQAGIRASIPG